MVTRVLEQIFITNIDELFFNDADSMRLSIFKDPWGGYVSREQILDDIIEGEGVSEFIEARGGDDRVYGGAGSDEVNLGRGNDFFDGGTNADDFDQQAYLDKCNWWKSLAILSCRRFFW